VTVTLPAAATVLAGSATVLGAGAAGGGAVQEIR
jgi:hypothetical protein